MLFGKERQRVARVIRDLVAFAPRGKGTNLAGALRYASKLLRHRAIIVVVSDFRAEGWEEALGQLAARHEVVAITVDDPREYDLPDAGWVELEDAETGKRYRSAGFGALLSAPHGELLSGTSLLASTRISSAMAARRSGVICASTAFAPGAAKG